MTRLFLFVLLCLARPVAAQDATADWSWRLRDLEGREFRLDRWRGEVLFVNVWATWCRPCVAELAGIERLAASLPDRGIRFLLVSPEPASRVRRWLAGRGYALAFHVEGSRMPPSFGLVGVPTTWIIDREGRVVLRRHGVADWDRDSVRDLLRALAGESGMAYNSAVPAGTRPE